MATIFRQTATLPDRSGKFRTSLILATRLYGGTWKPEAIAEFTSRAALPTKAIEVTDEEWERLEADNSLRFGYVNKPGDVESSFVPTPWVLG